MALLNFCKRQLALTQLIFLYKILYLCLVTSEAAAQPSGSRCDPITFDGILECTTQPDIRNFKPRINNCSGPKQSGTIAKYKCNPHFELYFVNEPSKEVDSAAEKELICGENGNWIGYQQFKSYGCREDCGKRLTNPKPLIINGVLTNSSIWPWHATLFRKVGQSKDFAYSCGASIIRKSTILTAAHCVTTAAGVKLPIDSILVAVGPTTNNLITNQARKDVQIFSVKKIFVSQSYDIRKEFQGDIAILQLNGQIEYGDQISPVCVPTDFAIDSNAIKPGRFGDVVGFGVDETMKLSVNLKHGSLEIKPHFDCYLRLQQTLSESQFCAGTQRGDIWTTVCNGDSGGGLFLPSQIHEKYYIHGIVSTGGSSRSASVQRGLCQNYAVFTRVFSFIPWIRDTLEEISGQTSIELDSSTAISYSQAGLETRRNPFNPIPQEYKNKAKSLELVYVDIDPEILLDSLEYCKSLQSINFTSVKFTRDFSNRKVRLPQLTSVSMDILTADAVLNNRQELSADFSQKFLKPLIFFEKQLDEQNFGLLNITYLRVDFDLTVHVFKVIRIHHQSGKIVLSKIPFASEILANAIQDPNFRIKHLALSSVQLSSDASYLLGLQAAQLETLVLDQVQSSGSQIMSSEFLKSMTHLQDFAFVAPSHSKSKLVELGNLAKNLKHLALSGAILDYKAIKSNQSGELPNRGKYSPSTTSKPLYPSSIVFPDSYSNRKYFQGGTPPPQPQQFELRQWTQLTTFYCDSCLPRDPSESLPQIALVFPRLQKLVLKLKSSSPISAIRQELLRGQQFKHLEFAFISWRISGGQVGGMKFMKQNGGRLVEQSSEAVNWQAEEVHLKYSLTRQKYFWSGEGDFVASKRLSTKEIRAFKSGIYRLDGNFRLTPDGFGQGNGNPGEDKLTTIPYKIQHYLETIEIVNALILPEELADSLEFCSRLKHLRLINASSPDLLNRKKVFVPELVEYRLQATFNPVWSHLPYHALAKLLETIFPDLFPYFEQQQDLQYNVKTKILRSRVQQIHLQYGNCVELSWNATEGSLVSGFTFINDWLQNSNRNHPVTKLAVKYWELESEAVPASVSNLNLNFAIVGDFGLMLQKINNLKDLRLINVRLNQNRLINIRNKKVPEKLQVDLSELARRHGQTLTYLALERAHLANFHSFNVRFNKLEFLYLESNTFDSGFPEKLTEIFPNLRNLVIMRESATDDFILLEAMKSRNLLSILSTIRSKSEKIRIANVRANDEIERILVEIGVPVNSTSSTYFVIERIGRKWLKSAKESDDSEVSSQLLEMKGTSVFGVDKRCHAWLDTPPNPLATRS